MLCDECHKNEASIYITELTNKGQVEHHLCESCALKFGLLSEKNNIFLLMIFYLEFLTMKVLMKINSNSN